MTVHLADKTPQTTPGEPVTAKEDDMHHIVSFSTGLSSAITAARVIARYGKDATTLVFMDTLFEDVDNYRFMADFERVHRVNILRLAEGRNPYGVSRDEHVIPNNTLAPCTFRLKIEPFRAWLAAQEKPLTVHIGYDWQELHRTTKTRENYEGLGYSVDFPLLWKPYEFRDYKQVAIEDWGRTSPDVRPGIHTRQLRRAMLQAGARRLA